MDQLQQKHVGFIGGGHMAEAILSGLLDAGTLSPQQVTVSDTSLARLEALRERYGVAALHNDAETNAAAAQLAEQSDILFLCVKPQFARPVFSAAGPAAGEDTLVVSIVGGATLDTLGQFFKGPVLRVMPNTPMQVRTGVAGIAPSANCAEADVALAVELFSALGKAYTLPEQLIDPLTGISGCGPAYCYLFIEALADGGVAAGLPREMALSLAAQTLTGAARMVLETGTHPARLKDEVCSPGGGTIAGVRALEEGGFRGVVMDAVDAGIRRMQELSTAL